MITKNEEGTIERSLKAIKEYPFELIVCDTGSTDSTRSIAEKYADKVVDFEWINDFSAARNYCASFASNDWVMAIDSDEYITKIDMEELEKLMRNNLAQVGRILIRSDHYGASSSEEALDSSALYIDRLYHTKYYHFTSKVHEQLTKVGGGHNTGFLAPVYVDHSGYAVSHDKVLEKNRRNIDLLHAALKDLEESSSEVPDTEFAYIYFQLGVSYNVVRDFTASHFYLEKAFSYNLPQRLDFVHLLAVRYGYSLLNIGFHTQALEYVKDMIGSYSYYADFLYMAGIVYKANRDYLSAILHFIKATTAERCTEAGQNSYIAFYQIGDCYAILGQYDMAKMFFEKSIQFPASKQALEHLEEVHAKHLI